jgi:mannose-6-phosphate isomerase-like protein (cupin superfamily)
MKITRVYTDDSGESHFEDVDIEFVNVNFAPPAPPLDISMMGSAVQYGILKAQPDWVGDWHPTPKRQVFFYLSGEIEAEVSDGEIRKFGPGDVTLVEDTKGKGHRSKVIGGNDVILAFVQLED